MEGEYLRSSTILFFLTTQAQTPIDSFQFHVGSFEYPRTNTRKEIQFEKNCDRSIRSILIELFIMEQTRHYATIDFSFEQDALGKGDRQIE